MESPTRLVLIGAGHAHLEVLRRMATEEHPPVELTVVSPAPRQLYSGMTPGFLYGEYSEEEISVELAPLVDRAGGSLVLDRAVGVEPEARAVTLASGERLPYDLVSFNVGSRTAGEDVPGVREHAARVKPIQQAVELRHRIDALAARPVVRTPDGVRGRRAVVVGAGAAGCEVACALATALDRESPRSADEDGVALVEAESTILPGYTERFRDRARTVIEGRGIDVWTRTRVTAVTPDTVEVEVRGRASTFPSDLTIWLTGPAAPPLFRGSELRESNLPLDDRGFLLVDSSLRSPSDPRIFGAGDCVTPADHPDTPKAGVYAVREAPLLWKSLRASLRGTDDPPTYRPQTGFLSILNTADGKALLRWKGLVSHGRWAWRLKDWIDRRFTNRYS